MATWGRTHDVLVASDECSPNSPGPAGLARSSSLDSTGVLAVHSVSKRSNLAGVRAGFYAGDPEVVAFLRLVRQHAGLMVPGPVQSAVALAYGRRRTRRDPARALPVALELLAEALGANGVDAPVPDGGFYLWCSMPGAHGWRLAELLADVAGLIVSPGDSTVTRVRRSCASRSSSPTSDLELVASRSQRSAESRYDCSMGDLEERITRGTIDREHDARESRGPTRRGVA